MGKGRPRQFDKDEALDKAMLVFWGKGYRGTSLDDLTEAMDINRPSLYSAFTDKEQLFLSVIDRYRTKFLAKPTQLFMAAPTLSEGLPKFFQAMGDVIINDETPPGCMIACLLTDDCCDSETIRSKLTSCIELADATFREVFELHKTELTAGVTPANAARLLTTALHGMAIRARAGASKRELFRISSTFVDLLLSRSAG